MNKDLVINNQVKQFALDEEVIRKYYCKNATEDEFKIFILTCDRLELDPVKNEIYFVKMKEKATHLVSYTAYLKRAERSGKLDGWECDVIKQGDDLCAVVTIYRRDQTHPVKWKVMMKEVYKEQGVWKEQPVFMLKKTAISQAFRLAFPNEIGEMPYTKEEMNEEVKEVIVENKVSQVQPEQLPLSEDDQKKEVIKEIIKLVESHGVKGIAFRTMLIEKKIVERTVLELPLEKLVGYLHNSDETVVELSNWIETLTAVDKMSMKKGA